MGDMALLPLPKPKTVPPFPMKPLPCTALPPSPSLPQAALPLTPRRFPALSSAALRLRVARKSPARASLSAPAGHAGRRGPPRGLSRGRSSRAAGHNWARLATEARQRATTGPRRPHGPAASAPARRCPEPAPLRFLRGACVCACVWRETNTNRHARRRSSRCGFTHFLSHSSGASLPRSRVERTENNRSDPPPRALRAPPTPSEPSGQVAFSRPSPEIPPGAEGSFPSRDRTLRALPGGPPRKGSRAATSHASPPPPRHASPRRGPPAPPAGAGGGSRALARPRRAP